MAGKNLDVIKDQHDEILKQTKGRRVSLLPPNYKPDPEEPATP